MVAQQLIAEHACGLFGGKAMSTGARPRHVIHLQKSIYGLAAIKKACYRFTDLCATLVSEEGDHWICEFHFGAEQIQEVERVTDEFLRELIDQELRESLRKETEPVRNLILAHAFSRTGLISDEPV